MKLDRDNRIYNGEHLWTIEVAAETTNYPWRTLNNNQSANTYNKWREGRERGEIE